MVLWLQIDSISLLRQAEKQQNEKEQRSDNLFTSAYHSYSDLFSFAVCYCLQLLIRRAPAFALL